MFARRKLFSVSLALAIALLGSVVLPSAAQAQTEAVDPNMEVTLLSGDRTGYINVIVGSAVNLQAQVKNTGNVPLHIIGSVQAPAGWEITGEPYNGCPDQLNVDETCTLNWVFTPRVAGQVFLRAYIKAVYTLPSGATNRFTMAPGFTFKVASTDQTQTSGATSSTSSTSSSSSSSTSVLPNMVVTLLANDVRSTAATIYAEQPLIFRAQVKNTGNVPLQIVAYLNVPSGWEVDEDPYSDCPDQLAVNDTCTISWKFTPQSSGEVFLWTYVKAIYTLPSGATNRFTAAPLFIFHVKPPKG